MKYAIVIFGGAADRPGEALGGKTPLQTAKAPTLARMGQTGRLGRVRLLRDDVEPGPDAAMMSLLGYEPAKRYSGRAPLAAAGLGVEVPQGAWVFHLSLFAADGGALTSFDDEALPAAEARALVQELLPRFDLPDAVIHPGPGATHLLVDHGQGDDASSPGYRDWSSVVTAPPRVILDQPIRVHLPVGEAQGERLQRLIADSAVALEGHEINLARREMGEPAVTHLWPWGQGTTPALKPWGRRFAQSAAVISADPAVRGLAELAGLDALEPPGGTDLAGALVRLGSDAVDAVGLYDLVIVHADTPAQAGYQGHVADKAAAITQIDEHVLKPLAHALAARGEHRLMATPLHATPTEFRRDEPDPVPFVITGYKMAGVMPRAVTEESAESCDLKVPYGHELMEFFLKSGVR